MHCAILLPTDGKGQCLCENPARCECDIDPESGFRYFQQTVGDTGSCICNPNDCFNPLFPGVSVCARVFVKVNWFIVQTSSDSSPLEFLSSNNVDPLLLCTPIHSSIETAKKNDIIFLEKYTC